MRHLLARYLLISDPHGMVIRPGKQKGQILRGIDRIIEGRINQEKKRNNPTYFQLIRSFQNDQPYDCLIVLGDFIECVWNERGILIPRDIRGIEIFKAAIEMNVPVEKNCVHFIPGDHELGYKLPLSVDPEGGISLASIENFQYILGLLFTSWKIGNFNFVTISSSLFSQSTEHLECGERQKVEALKREQKIFLAKLLLKTSENEKIFLFLHDPDATEFIDKFPCAKKITRIFSGHIHTEGNFRGYQTLGKISNSFWGRLILRLIGLVVGLISFHPRRVTSKVSKVIAWAKKNPRRLKLFEKYNLQRVPSSSVLHGGQPGFLVLELYDNEEYEIQKFGA